MKANHPHSTSKIIIMATKLFQLPSSLQSRCQRKYGWEITFAKKALKGYQHFMKLKKLHEDWNATKLSPSIVIGQVWHMHMLDPRHYSNACQEYCDGEIIGHDPEGALDEETRKLRRKNPKTPKPQNPKTPNILVHIDNHY